MLEKPQPMRVERSMPPKGALASVFSDGPPGRSHLGDHRRDLILNGWLRTQRGTVLVALMLAGIVCLQTFRFQNQKSITFDETFYLSCALQTVHDGRLDRELVRKGSAPLPVLVAWWVPSMLAGGADRPDRWQGRVDDPRHAHTARRLHATVIGVAMVWFVFGWLLRRRGLLAASVAGGLLAFSPTILAHAAIAGADLCFVLLTVIALAALDGMTRFRTTGRIAVAGVACGFAFSAKYSAAFLFPLAGLLLALPIGVVASRGWWQRGRDLLGCCGNWSFLMATALVTSWALHGFDLVLAAEVDGFRGEHVPTWLTAISSWRLPAPLAGMLCQYLHNQAGHRAFLLGQVSVSGWWYYFPCVFVFKSTPSELLLGGVMVLGGLTTCWRGLSEWNRGAAVASLFWRDRDVTRWVWWSALLLYLALIGNARVQIGQRYLLVLYPLIVMLGIDGLAQWGRCRSLRCGLAMTVLLGLQIWNGLSIGPHYLAYFAPWVGGPGAGSQLLGDSNLDWGQDLPALRAKLAEKGFQKVALSYFGTADPAAYGVRSRAVNQLSVTELLGCDCLAVSVNHLSGLYPLEGPLRVLPDLIPVSRAGFSILLFDLRRRDLRDRLEALRSSPVSHAAEGP